MKSSVGGRFIFTKQINPLFGMICVSTIMDVAQIPRKTYEVRCPSD